MSQASRAAWLSPKGVELGTRLTVILMFEYVGEDIFVISFDYSLGKHSGI